jgi:hypothetical protein
MSMILKNIPIVDSQLKDSTVLWRYLDAAKFLDLIHTQKLFFTRGDQFEDKFEGAFTDSIKKAIEKSYKDNQIDFTYAEFKKRLRERVFLNCWCASSDDIMAMWNIYGRSPTALAITTTVAKLRNSISNIGHGVTIKKVSYIKHWRDPKLDTKPYSNVFAYKVKAYAFEKEVRVIIDRFHEEFDSEISETSMRVSIPLDKLLRSIVVAPEAPEWFLDLIKDVTTKYGVRAPVRRSKLALPPL